MNHSCNSNYKGKNYLEVPKASGKAGRKDSQDDYVSDCSTMSDLTQATETAEFDQSSYTAVKISHQANNNSKNKYIGAAKLASINTDE